MEQDNVIYKFSIELSLSSKGQNKSKLQKLISNILISTMTAAFLISLILAKTMMHVCNNAYKIFFVLYIGRKKHTYIIMVTGYLLRL